MALIHPDWLTHARSWAADVLAASADTCTITRAATTPGSFDPATGVTAPDPPATVYTGVCVVQAVDRQPVASRVAEDLVRVGRYRTLVPLDVDAQVDDVVTVTVSTDPSLQGARLRVADVDMSTFAPWRVLICDHET